MIFLIETPTYDTKQKVVKTTKTGKAIIETVLQTLNDLNRNNRVYEKKAIIEGIENPHIKERMENKTFGGELDHPVPTSDDQFNLVRQTTLMFKEMSHIIKEINIDGNIVNAVVETTSTPNGFTMAGLIRDGVKVGFSLRAMGDNVKRVGNAEYVQPPITIISYDCVSFPSHKGAYMKEIVELHENTHIIEEAKQCKDGVCALVEHIKYSNKHNIILNESNNSIDSKDYTSFFKSNSYHLF